MFKDYRVSEVSMEILQANLKRLRLFMGLTQADLAEMIDYTRQQLSAYENGKAKINASFYLTMTALCQRFYDSVEDYALREIVSNELIVTFYRKLPQIKGHRSLVDIQNLIWYGKV